MFAKEGFAKVTASGALVKKHCGENQGGKYAFITIVHTEEHKGKEYNHYIEAILRGHSAKYVESSVNTGDSVMITGDLVSMSQSVNDQTVTKMKVRCETIQSHRLPSRATMERIQGARQPEQPVPVEAQQAQPQPQQGQALQDFDDDIPF